MTHHYLLLSETFKNTETMKANYQIFWLAFYAFDYDKINVSLSKNYKPRVTLTPTKPNVDEICTSCCGNKAIIPRI